MSLNGLDSDFNSHWFGAIGHTIMQATGILAFVYIGIDLVYFFLRYLARKKDYWQAEDGYQSKSVHIQQYVDIHCGPVYQMHYKYSNMQNIVFITMTFGVGMPVLFPMAAISFAAIYVHENYMLYYVV